MPSGPTQPSRSLARRADGLLRRADVRLRRADGLLRRADVRLRRADVRLRLLLAAGAVCGAATVTLAAQLVPSSPVAAPARRPAPGPSWPALGVAPGLVATSASPAVPYSASGSAPVAAGPAPTASAPSSSAARPSSGSAPSAPATAPPASVPAPKPETNRTAPAQSPPPSSATGPVAAGDFPDPSILRVGAVYYAYSTQVGATRLPVLRSADLVHWQTVGDGLANLPAWSGGASVWAPSVVPSATGYVLFYTTHDNRTGDQCISRAVSAFPQGPFVDTSANPFECQLGLGGSIDPQAFVDASGAQWLIWKSQGTARGQAPQIWAQAVGDDWRVLVGLPHLLLGVSQAWEGGVIEAPAMVREGGRYLLFYSGNDWNSSHYAIGYAVCRSVTGPCAKPQATPVVSSHGIEAGPGSPSVFTDPVGHLYIAFHAWTVGHVGYPGGQRSLHLGTLSAAGGKISIADA